MKTATLSVAVILWIYWWPGTESNRRHTDFQSEHERFVSRFRADLWRGPPAPDPVRAQADVL